MKQLLTILLNIILYIWQLPQNILGLIFLLFLKSGVTKKEKNFRGDTNVYVSKGMSGGISLGKYIYLSPTMATDKKVWNHEFGHTRQSRMLGPLYLLVIGLPSICWAAYYGNFVSYTVNGYYKFYTEKWADKLGGVIRK